MKKWLIGAILILAFAVRLYRIDNPLADWHSWRQADTSAVSRNFLKHGFDLWHPRFDDLSSIASKLDNPHGYRFVEFPFYNLIQAGAAKCLPVFSLEVWGRLISIGFSVVSTYLIYLITKKYINQPTAWLAAFFFSCLPFSIYYGRTILPESMMITASLAMIYFCYRPVLFILFGIIAVLIKPFVLVLWLPIWLVSKNKYRLLWHFALVILPLIVWRLWMSQYTEGIPQSAWLFNGDGIRLKGAWFYWLFYQRLALLILGGWGLVLFGMGVIVKINQKENWFFHYWLGAILAYFIVIATGNVRHDYYQVIALPVICIFLAKGSYFLLTVPKEYFSKIICCLLFATCLLFMLAFSWYQVRDYFNINNPAIIEAGKTVDQLIPIEAKVITPYNGDTAFLYQTKRQGWPIGFEIEKKISQGAQYYVSVNFDQEAAALSQTYCLLKKTADYLIIDLTRKCPTI